ncbi:MAG: 4Fe-4S binding protein [Treponema sp.]|nr:4Fe-4S binding protein [Treponema sp.]
MVRKIIKIDEDKCNGCGLCANACHEGAIAMVNGKAKLIRDDYCDGLGNCLPVCATGAITFEEREAAAFDEEAVKAHMEQKEKAEPLACGCPGTNAKALKRPEAAGGAAPAPAANQVSELRQWPVQIKLVPVKAPYFENAHLLIAADCAAYAYAGFHEKFMKNKITIIGCPKLDDVDYSEKLTEIITVNNIKSVAVVRMEVPCCGGIEHAVTTAIKKSGKFLPWQVITLTTNGGILEG